VKAQGYPTYVLVKSWSNEGWRCYEIFAKRKSLQIIKVSTQTEWCSLIGLQIGVCWFLMCNGVHVAKAKCHGLINNSLLHVR
jgi:hypothetical protein